MADIINLSEYIERKNNSKPGKIWHCYIADGARYEMEFEPAENFDWSKWVSFGGSVDPECSVSTASYWDGKAWKTIPGLCEE
jgi:hypothetical protein